MNKSRNQKLLFQAYWHRLFVDYAGKWSAKEEIADGLSFEAKRMNGRQRYFLKQDGMGFTKHFVIYADKQNYGE